MTTSMSTKDETTKLANSTYDIIRALETDATFLYSTVDTYIEDAQKGELPTPKLWASCSTVTWFTRTFPASATELLISAGVHSRGSMSEPKSISGFTWHVVQVHIYAKTFSHYAWL
jgi:hypothetical protein